MSVKDTCARAYSRAHEQIARHIRVKRRKGASRAKAPTFVAEKKIPYLKVGHRTLLFDPEKVEKALQRFEIPAINAK